VLFYEKFTESFPSEVLLAAEIYSRMTTGFGYPVIIGKWEDIIEWVKEQNTVLELEVRHYFSEMTKGSDKNSLIFLNNPSMISAHTFTRTVNLSDLLSSQNSH